MNDTPAADSGFLERVVALAADLSGYTPGEILPDISFTELGFDSLSLTQLSQVLRSELGVEISFRLLMEDLASPRELARHLDRTLPAPKGARENDSPAPGPVARPTDRTLPPPDPAPFVRDDEAASTLEALLVNQLSVMRKQLDLLGGPGMAAAVAPHDTPGARAAAPEEAPGKPKAGTSAPEVGGTNGTGTPERVAPTERPARRERLTPHQEKHLRELAKRYSERTAGSKAHAAAFRKAHADPRTASGFDRRWKEIVYPLVVTHSEGSVLRDVDGNEYIDLVNGFGPNFLGHRAPCVVEALQAQLDRGIEVGPQTPLAGETAALVCELTGMDRATFACSGSEAVQAAMRAARTHTGRNRIVVFRGAYHGNFDQVLVRDANRNGRIRTLPAAPGVPQGTVDDIVVLEYGDAASLDVIRSLDDVAAVLVEPVQSRRPELQPREFLHELRSLTRKAGSLLIFDEVVTGFRCHPGGAQAHFGVEADLVTYGKVVAGGMPIGIVAGRDPFMDVFDGGSWEYGDTSFPGTGVTFSAGTFVRHPLAIAAAHATLSYLKSAGPQLQADVAARTEEMVERIETIFREMAVPISIPRFSSVLYVRTGEAGELADLLFHFLRLEGVFALPGFPAYLTAAHSPEDVDRVVEAFRKSAEAMRRARFFASPDEGTSAATRAVAQVSEPSPSQEPPVSGARLGQNEDGSPGWYVEDPPGSEEYLRVD
ncbi:MAG: aminotransferase class III-fold pyridoxal phosphate-dependent enzyme [Longimicrobiales bacterium]|nr:aminotransferase class III-fold pyridoxal phosphate-dependent enzyme [Longimicrobiales bacterium]